MAAIAAAKEAENARLRAELADIQKKGEASLPIAEITYATLAGLELSMFWSTLRASTITGQEHNKFMREIYSVNSRLAADISMPIEDWAKKHSGKPSEEAFLAARQEWEIPLDLPTMQAFVLNLFAWRGWQEDADTTAC